MNRSINQIGFWAGIISFSATASYIIVQLLQLLGILHYPLDEILIYSTSLCITIPFLLEMLAFHYITPANKKFWSHAALLFTCIYVVFVTANYVVQLATVIPARANGLPGVPAVLDQTPHSMFWDFDALGYVFMGLATLVAIPAFERQGYHRRARLFFLANALVTPLIGIVYFYPYFSDKLVLLALPWAVTAPGAMLSLAVIFKKRQHYQQHPDTKQLYGQSKNAERGANY